MTYIGGKKKTFLHNNPVASAKFLTGILDVPWEAERGHFTPTYLHETLTLDFAQREQFDRHHYCFHVSDAEFDGIFARVRAAGIPYHSTPQGPEDLQRNTRLGGRNFYWNYSHQNEHKPENKLQFTCNFPARASPSSQQRRYCP